MKKLPVISACAAAAAILASCGHSAADKICRLEIAAPMEGLDGAWAYIVNYDTGEKTDSVPVESDSVRISINAAEPYAARLIIDGKRAGSFIVQPGTVTLDSTGNFTGTPLNDSLTALGRREEQLGKLAAALPQDSAGIAARDSINTLWLEIYRSTARANAGNPLGYLCQLNLAYLMDLTQVDSLLKAQPDLAKYTRFTKLRDALERKEQTSVGHRYKDFTVQSDSVTTTLSQYVGVDGKFTLVDFWASWCGPCRREIPVIKEIARKYADKINVVGVAVWDKPEDTLHAISELEITWPVITDAQSVPTDIYGISGIPCIILINPEGVIVSRDLQGEELAADVARIIEEAEKAGQDAENAG